MRTTSRHGWTWPVACALAGLTVAPVLAQEAVPSPAQAVAGRSFYGVSASSGSLVRHDFSQSQTQSIGTLTTADGTAMLGVQAAAYFPGFQNLFALWTNPADGKNKLVYVNLTSAATTVVAQDLEGGRFTGATTLVRDGQHLVFAMQQAKTKPPRRLDGQLNLNPNNRDDMEFVLVKPDGSQITRDDLHQNAQIDADGTFYQGEATWIRVRPKGNGNQNSLTVNGQTLVVQNSNTYTFDFTSDPQPPAVRVYNDKPRNGKAMGHWWIGIAGYAFLNNETKVITPDRVTQIDHQTGVVTEIMPLNQSYEGVTTTDGSTFFVVHDNSLWVIDTTSQTETQVGPLPTAVSDLDIVDGNLLVFDPTTQSLIAVDPQTGQSQGSTAPLGGGETSVIVFTPLTQDPFGRAVAFD